jgi:hypothetical protein
MLRKLLEIENDPLLYKKKGAARGHSFLIIGLCGLVFNHFICKCIIASKADKIKACT